MICAHGSEFKDEKPASLPPRPPTPVFPPPRPLLPPFPVPNYSGHVHGDTAYSSVPRVSTCSVSEILRAGAR